MSSRPPRIGSRTVLFTLSFLIVGCGGGETLTPIAAEKGKTIEESVVNNRGFAGSKKLPKREPAARARFKEGG